MANLRSLADERYLRDREVELHHVNLGKLARHMYEISNDPSGSDPSRYLSQTDIGTLEQFFKMAAELGWPNATRGIDMRAGRVAGIPIWTSSQRTAKAGLTKALFFPRIAGAQRGYAFGRLNVLPTQSVAVCEDGLLRSRRGSGNELSRSNGDGWGRLPEPEYLLAAIEPVTTLLSYSPFRSLEEALLSRIEPENFRNP